jgi:ribosomal 30S subunit maturation factor RimM
MSNENFVKVQAELDAVDLHTTIRKVDKKMYNLLVNFEIVKSRKQRRSLKNHVIKLHSEKCPESKLIEVK